MFEVPKVRKKLSNAWEKVWALQKIAEQVDLDGVTRVTPSPRSIRTDHVSQTEGMRSGHGCAQPAVGDYNKHWTQMTGIQRSPQASRLLSMPQEIIDLIMDYVIGHQVLHVDKKGVIQEDHVDMCERDQYLCTARLGPAPPFLMSICAADISEDEAWSDFQFGYRTVPEKDNEVYYVADGPQRHDRCRRWENDRVDCTKWSALSPYAERLSILHVCSRLSPLAFHTFWTTNTFSFGDVTSFEALLLWLNDTQKAAIRRVNLNFHIPPKSMEFDPCQIVKLRSLDMLRLCLHTSVFGFVPNSADGNISVDQLDLRKQPGYAVLRLEVLNVNSLKVIIYDHESEFSRRGAGRFNLDEKRQLARAVHSIIMAPEADREVLAREDRQIFELEELIKGLRFAQDVRWQMQRASFTRGA
ncbi:MAG: hypothetical protein Q9170_007010 [Blastenia crenularia]